MRKLMLLVLIGTSVCGLALSCRTHTTGTADHTVQVGDVQLSARLMEPSGKPVAGSVDSAPQLPGDETVHFQVRIDKNTEPSFKKEQLLYLNFDMQQDFTLVVQQDTVAAGFCQRIENGRKNSYEYIVAFEDDRLIQPKDYMLLYQDKIFGVGTVAFVCHL